MNKEISEGLSDYSQFTIFAEQQGCKFQGVIGMVPCEKRKHIRVESWELPECDGFVLMVNEKTGQIGVYDFVGKDGEPLIRDIEWLKNKTRGK